MIQKNKEIDKKVLPELNSDNITNDNNMEEIDLFEFDDEPEFDDLSVEDEFEDEELSELFEKTRRFDYKNKFY